MSEIISSDRFDDLAKIADFRIKLLGLYERKQTTLQDHQRSEQLVEFISFSLQQPKTIIKVCQIADQGEKIHVKNVHNLEQGFKLMKQCESSDEDDEVEKIGQKYLVNLNNLFTKNCKGLNYVKRYKEESRKKDHALQLLKEQIKRSTEKIEKLGKTKINQHPYQSKTANNKSTLERYISIKASRETGNPNEKSYMSTSPHLSKSSRYYKTISFGNKSSLTRSQTPKKRDGELTPYSVRNVLPDIKKIRKNIRM